MKKSDIEKAVVAYSFLLSAQDAKGSTASHAKMADFSVRDYLMARGVSSADDVRCRASGAYDWQVYRARHRFNGETKVGCGALRYGKTAEEVACVPEHIYPTVDFIAYCAEPAKLKAHPERAPKLFRVFTREQFLAMLTATGKKGLASSLRVHQTKSGTWQLEIQPWQTKQTMARLAKYETWVIENAIPTLEQFREWLRG